MLQKFKRLGPASILKSQAQGQVPMSYHRPLKTQFGADKVFPCPRGYPRWFFGLPATDKRFCNLLGCNKEKIFEHKAHRYRISSMIIT